MTDVHPRAADGSDDDDRRRAAPRHPSRREFAAALLAGGAAASVVGVAALGACAPPAVTAATATSRPPSSLPDTTALATAHRADPTTEALFAAVDARYGGRLEADEKARVRDAIGRTVRLSAALRGQGLANGVDPFSSFCHATLTAPTAAAVTGGAGKGA